MAGFEPRTSGIYQLSHNHCPGLLYFSSSSHEVRFSPTMWVNGCCIFGQAIAKCVSFNLIKWIKLGGVVVRLLHYFMICVMASPSLFDGRSQWYRSRTLRLLTTSDDDDIPQLTTRISSKLMLSHFRDLLKLAFLTIFQFLQLLVSLTRWIFHYSIFGHLQE